jgi:hypothetical protein
VERAQAQPSRKVLLRGPVHQIGANLTQQYEGRVLVDALARDQVYARGTKERQARLTVVLVAPAWECGERGVKPSPCGGQPRFVAGLRSADHIL